MMNNQLSLAMHHRSTSQEWHVAQYAQICERRLEVCTVCPHTCSCALVHMMNVQGGVARGWWFSMKPRVVRMRVCDCVHAQRAGRGKQGWLCQ